ncbi:unnamed protein product, partial [Phaeothamnion confervicola]
TALFQNTLVEPPKRASWGRRPATRLMPRMPLTAVHQAADSRMQAYVTLLRPQNIGVSAALVSVGAAVASHSAQAVADPKVLLTALAAALIAVGSCVLNDLLDIELDRINKPDRPLVTGAVSPSHAAAIAALCLSGACASAWLVSPLALQAVILASVALVSAYTTLLKPLPLVKNMVTAGIIAASVASGGLAAGASVHGTLAPMAITFFGTVHREILMDINDAAGDAVAGVRTIPVL